jgi:predicted unusual protein kinase regulating ubiquinone biosynthesis (AarF/ABC1/UbiB family)
VYKDEEANRQERANELLELIQKAGPTAIKVGQALSVRPDLIPLEYADALGLCKIEYRPFPVRKHEKFCIQN